jgi:hypothetical protein
MRARRRDVLAVLAAAFLTSACTDSLPAGDAGAGLRDPVAVIERWNDTRNQGDVASAFALLADDATVLGYRLGEPGDRAELAEILASRSRIPPDRSRVRGHRHHRQVRLRDDRRGHARWDLALSGVHLYEVVDGRITSAACTHDRASSDRVYRELEVFRRWVIDRHPDLVEVICSTPGAAAYTTVLGARTMLSLLDEYQTATTGGPP